MVTHFCRLQRCTKPCHVAPQRRTGHPHERACPEAKSIDDAALAQLFTDARTHNGFLDRRSRRTAQEGGRSRQDRPDQRQPIADADRVPEVAGSQGAACAGDVGGQSRQDQLGAGNRHRRLRREILRASAVPVSACRRETWFSGNEAFAKRSAFQNGTLQVAYLIIALRAVGLDTGPMTGFDNAKVDAAFFPEGHLEVERHHQHRLRRRRNLFPRSPRFHFDQIAKIL